MGKTIIGGIITIVAMIFMGLLMVQMPDDTGLLKLIGLVFIFVPIIGMIVTVLGFLSKISH